MHELRIVQQPMADVRTGGVLAHFEYRGATFSVQVHEEWLWKNFPDVHSDDPVTIFNARRAEIEDHVAGVLVRNDDVPSAVVLSVR